MGNNVIIIEVRFNSRWRKRDSRINTHHWANEDKNLSATGVAIIAHYFQEHIRYCLVFITGHLWSHTVPKI